MDENIPVRNISDGHKKILIEWLSGSTYQEIGSSHGFTRQRAEQIVASYFPAKLSHRGRRGIFNYPFYPHLTEESSKKFRSIRELSKKSGVSQNGMCGMLIHGAHPRLDIALKIYSVLETDKPFEYIFQKEADTECEPLL